MINNATFFIRLTEDSDLLLHHSQTQRFLLVSVAFRRGEQELLEDSVEGRVGLGG